MTGWAIASLFLQVSGLVITAAGLSITWREFHDPDERFVDEAMGLARRIVVRIPRPWRRRSATVNVDLASAVAMAASVTTHVTYGPPPEDVREALELLTKRAEDLQNSLSRAMSDAAVRLDGQDVRIGRLEGHIAEEVDRLERADRRVATDGIHLEAFGLVVLAVGIVCAAIDAATATM